MERRRFFRLSAAAVTGLPLACSRASPGATATTGSQEAEATARGVERKALHGFLAGARENYFNGRRKVLEVGNTDVMAGMIRDALIHAGEPYSDLYEPTVQRNAKEKEENARPGIVDLADSIAAYDTVLIGSPI